VKFFMAQIPDFFVRNWPRSRVPKFLAGRATA
jgi:predicted component of type VI protein secretion system